MLLLGLLLLAGAGAFAGLLISGNRAGGPDYTVMMLGHKLGTLNTLGAFVAGIVVTLVFFLGLAIVADGFRRARRTRRLSAAAPVTVPAVTRRSARTVPTGPDDDTTELDGNAGTVVDGNAATVIDDGSEADGAEHKQRWGRHLLHR